MAVALRSLPQCRGTGSRIFGYRQKRLGYRGVSWIPARQVEGRSCRRGEAHAVNDADLVGL